MMPVFLGLAGLLPAFACLYGVLAGGPEWRFTALAAGFGYSALIFSFIGGMWWGLASRNLRQVGSALSSGWIYFAAIMPSLIAFALYLPWIFGAQWPGPSMVWLGLAIAASPLVDQRIAGCVFVPPWWMRLRWTLSGGLGAATLVMGIAA